MIGTVCVLTTPFSGPAETTGAAPGTGACVVTGPGVIARPEEVNGGFARSGIGRVRLWTRCSFCRRAARKASTSLAKAVRLGSVEFKGSRYMTQTRAFQRNTQKGLETTKVRAKPLVTCSNYSMVHTYIHTYIHKLYFLSNFRVACNTINISSYYLRENIIKKNTLKYHTK